MAEEYNIPEPNSYDSMEGIEKIDDFNSEEFVLDESDENQEKQNVEELLHDLIYSESDPDYDGVNHRDVSAEEMKKIRKERVEELRKGVKEMIKEWHDLIKPKYVILTETAGTPFGYVFKEMWRVAYPDEELPRFYRIDPKAVASYLYNDDEGEFDASNDEGVKYLEKRIKDRDANIILFDESIASGDSLRVLQSNLAYGRYINGQLFIHGKIKWRDEDFLENHALKDEHLFSYWGFGPKGKNNLKAGMMVDGWFGGDMNPRGGANIEIHPVPYKFRVTKKSTDTRDPYNKDRKELTSNIKRGSEGLVALRNISRLKMLGKLLGQEMREEAAQK